MDRVSLVSEVSSLYKDDEDDDYYMHQKIRNTIQYFLSSSNLDS